MADEIQAVVPGAPEVPVAPDASPIVPPVVEPTPVTSAVTTEVVTVDGEEFVQVTTGNTVVLVRL